MKQISLSISSKKPNSDVLLSFKTIQQCLSSRRLGIFWSAKGQSKLFSVIDTLGRARAGNKAGIEAQHSLGGCWERADAGLCPPCCAAATRTRGALARWVAGHGLGLLLSEEGEQNVASCARACQGWEVAGNSGGL